jgi:hypothetical protein
MTWRIATTSSLIVLSVILLLGSSRRLSAAQCDRACLLEQAKQFNENMLAHSHALARACIVALQRL